MHVAFASPLLYSWFRYSSFARRPGCAIKGEKRKFQKYVSKVTEMWYSTSKFKIHEAFQRRLCSCTGGESSIFGHSGRCFRNQSFSHGMFYKRYWIHLRSSYQRMPKSRTVLIWNVRKDRRQRHTFWKGVFDWGVSRLRKNWKSGWKKKRL